MCLVDVVNGELCDLVEYVHECFCALLNLVNCVLDDVCYTCTLGDFKWCCLFGEMTKCESYVCD